MNGKNFNYFLTCFFLSVKGEIPHSRDPTRIAETVYYSDSVALK